MKIAIIGMGYVGRSIAQAVVGAGHSVVGFDTDSDVISSLSIGGDFKGTTDAALLGSAEVVVIAVPTPLTVDKKPDMSFIESACKVIAENLKNDALIINESTSYPGTVRRFIKPLIERLAPERKHMYAVSPERVDPGRLDWNQTNTPRLFAGLTKEATDKTRAFYGTFAKNLVEVSKPEVAEAAKLFENTYRQVNIALVNEFAQISHALDIPVREVLDAADTKPYGFTKFTPSAGVGGHCIPVDPSYLAQVAEEHGVKAKFIELSNKVNLQMGSYIVERVKKDNGGNLRGKSVQIIGVSYKPNVADVRETPAEQIHLALEKEGAVISWHDPLVETWNGSASSKLGADIAIVVTKHDALDSKAILESTKYVLDTSGKVIGAVQL